MSMFSFAGQTRLFPQPGVYADLSVGHGFAISVVNATGADITSGTITIQDAQSLADDFCVPDDATWADVEEVPDCTNPAGVAGPATITFTPEFPLRAWSECQYAFPCTRQWLRATPLAGTVVNVIVGRLKRVSYG